MVFKYQQMTNPYASVFQESAAKQEKINYTLALAQISVKRIDIHQSCNKHEENLIKTHES